MVATALPSCQRAVHTTAASVSVMYASDVLAVIKQ